MTFGQALRGTVLMAAALVAPPLGAQDRPGELAAIRAELAALATDLQALRSATVTGGAAAVQAAGGASALERMDAIEARLVQLTAQSEALQNRVDRVVGDGTNRIGDLEFRLCELEPGCNTASLPITATLGGAGTGGAPIAVPVTAPAGAGAGAGGAAPELAISEKADFDRAKGALGSGDFQGAADQFAAFGQAYPGSPLGGEAQLLRGEALARLGQTSNAARAYLEAYSGAPNGAHAPAALLGLGAALGDLGQTQEACVTLAEIGRRFGTAPQAVEAGAAMRRFACP
jgi:tol-pal system protein YbgF